MTAAALLLAVFADTSVSLVADAAEVRLSGTVRVALAVRGPAPLRVEVPPGSLDAESAGAWKVVPAGPPVEAAGRWTREFVADPFVPGEAVRLGFAPVRVWAGGATPPRQLAPAPLSVRVTTGVADVSPAAARPVTGVELPPDPPPTPGVWERLRLAAGVAASLFVLVLLVAQTSRVKRRPAPPADPLAGLDALSDAAFAHRLSDAVRDRLHTDAVPARMLVTPDLPAGPARDLLAALDPVRFGGHLLTPAERAAMLEAARRFPGST